MKCSRCEHENEAGAKFCEECAAPLARTCTNCGRPLSPRAKFCPECARPTTSGPPAATIPRFTSPEAYTPQHLAEKILTSKAALEGERKQVTVLFADLKGSMELLAGRDPEEARKLLDPVLEHMMEAVHRYEGTVNQVMGDGIMALFGAPLAHEDHAVRACYAALRMQESVKRYAEAARHAHGMNVQIRVGVNSGEVVVRAIGSDLHMDYTAVGQTTHLAARMEQLAPPGTVVLSPATRQLVEGLVEVKPLGLIPVKGLADPIDVFELTGASSHRTRFQVSVARSLSPLVGRDAELDLLQRALERARAGHGQVVAVVGEPGVGKSRLVHEFLQLVVTEDWRVLQTGAVSYGKATSYLAVVALLRAYFQTEPADVPADIRDKVTRKLASIDPTLEALAPPILALLDVPTGNAEWERLDPPQRRQRTLDAVKRLILQESQGQPLLLVIEDLHWIDGETQAFLDALVESLPTARVLLLVNYRPEYAHTWGTRTYYRQFHVEPLAEDGADELLRALLGDDVSTAALRRLLIERTDGNPFFIEESVNALAETATLVGRRGAYRLSRPVGSLQIPATAQAVLAARIDRLPPEHKRLLQAAAVIGKDAPFVLIEAVAEQSEADLRAGLTQLQAAEFLYEVRLFPDLEFTFKHALTHEVAYGSMLQERRRTLHVRTLIAVERLYAERPEEHAERLAHHAQHGEEWEKAVGYHIMAGTKANRISAYREAALAFRRALEALRRLPESRARIEKAIEIHGGLRRSLIALGEMPDVLENLKAAEVLADRIHDLKQLSSLHAGLAFYYTLCGDARQAIAYGHRAQTVARARSDLATQVDASLYLGRAYFMLGEYGQAIQSATNTITLLPGPLAYERFSGTGLPAVGARTQLIQCLAELGRFAETADPAESGLRLARTADHPFSISHICWGIGLVRLRQGEIGAATVVLEEAVRVCNERGVPGRFPPAAGLLGVALAYAGRIEEGLALIELALERAAGLGLMAWHAENLCLLGETLVLARRPDRALAAARESLDTAQARGERGQEAWTLRLLAEIALGGGTSRWDEARDLYDRGLALADGLGMRPLVAHYHLGLGQLSRRTGERQETQEHLMTATAMYREMDMHFWLEVAEIAMSESP